ncbi:MAG: hypothetical protein LC104_11145 [Bacteroidales bacterium]|nr:hypothetical protein [Bacteroidales bacterium]
MHVIALDLFACCNCGQLLRSRQVHRGTDCQCPYCGRTQLIPGTRKSLLGKIANAWFYGGSFQGMPHSLCPHCHSYTDTFASVCSHCTRDLPPLVG